MKKIVTLIGMICWFCFPSASQELGIFTNQSFLGDNWTWEEDNSYDPATDTYSIVGSGWDMYGTFDGMTFIYKEIGGSFMITADLAWGDQEFPGGTPESGNEWKKMGLMARVDGEDMSSPNVIAAVRNDMGHLLQWRETNAGDTQYTGYAAKESTDTNVIQLKRINNLFMMLRQTTDGSFRVVASREVDLPKILHVGLAVSAHDKEAAERGLFRNVNIAPIELGVTCTRSFVESKTLVKSGDTLSILVNVFVEEGKTAELAVNETLPQGWTASRLTTSSGDASSNGNTITWSIPEASGSNITLTYDATVGSETGFTQFTGIVKAGVDEQLISGDSPLFVVNQQNDLGIFDGSADITGDPSQLGAEGGVVYNPLTQTYTILGSGWDIYDYSDSFHYLYKKVPIDQPILLKARIVVDPFTGNGEWTKCGLMIRNGLDSADAEVMATLRSDQGFFWQWREEYAGASNWSGSTLTSGSGEGEQNGTIAISRDPETNRISIFYYDSATEEKVEAGVCENIDMSGSYDDPDTVYIGLAVTAHDVGRLSIGTFSDVVFLIGDITGVGNWMIFE